MDTGKGFFEMHATLEEAQEAARSNPLSGGIFTKDEIVELKGSRFRVSQILSNGLKLALLPKE